jgi:hypothetical protein
MWKRSKMDEEEKEGVDWTYTQMDFVERMT